MDTAPITAAIDKGVPIGWSRESTDLGDLGWDVKKFAGLLLTVLAISLGAPFWFDLLNKIVNVRATGKPPNG